MVQPLSQRFTNELYSLCLSAATEGRAQDIFEARHHFASAAMEVIVGWSHVETQIVALIAKLCEGSMSDAFAIYSTIESAPTKRKIVAELVDRKYSAADHKAACAVLKFSSVCEKKRNQIAHHTWGFFHDTQIDGVILIDPRHWAYQAQFDKTKAFVWSMADFSELKQDMYDLKQCYDMLRSLNDAEGHDVYYSTIISKPKVYQYL